MDENMLYLCNLTSVNVDPDYELLIELWLNRVMEENAYHKHEEYTAPCVSYTFCLSGYEVQMLKRFLYDNCIVDFILEVTVNQGRSTFSAVSFKEEPCRKER